MLPWLILIPWIDVHGIDLPRFASTIFASGGAAVFSADVLFATGVFLIFMMIEGRRLRLGRQPWLAVLLLVCFGLYCALPAFLAMRERRLSATPARPLP